MEERYKSKIVVDLLLERQNIKTNQNEILLMLRKNREYFDNMYDLPGGHVDSNEDLFQSMIREAKEEIGTNLLRDDLPENIIPKIKEEIMNVYSNIYYNYDK